MGVWFLFFYEYEEGYGREGLSEYLYLLILMKLWTGYWNNKLERMKVKVDKENGKAAGMVNGSYRKARKLSRNEFGRTLVVSFQLLPLVLGCQGCGTMKRCKR